MCPLTAAIAKYAEQAAHRSTVEFVLNIIPDSVVGAFAKGDILQVLLFSILFGFPLMARSPLRPASTSRTTNYWRSRS
jgi:aerobic C4-dicarboxylate transport protein